METGSKKLHYLLLVIVSREVPLAVSIKIIVFLGCDMQLGNCNLQL